MSQWKDDFYNSQFHVTMENILDSLNNPEVPPHNGDVLVVNRFYKIFFEIYEKVKNYDPDLIDIQKLNEFDSTIRTHFYNNIIEFKKNGDISNTLTPLLSSFGLLTTITFLPFLDISNTERKLHLEDVYNNLSEKINKANTSIEILTKEVDRLEKEREALNLKIKNEKEAAAQLAAQFQTQFTTAENGRKTEFTEIQNNMNKEFSLSQNDRLEKFTESQAIYKDGFSNSLQEVNSFFSNWKKSNTNEMEDYFLKTKESVTNQLNEIINESNEKLKNICELHQLVAGESVTAGYAQTAKEQGELASRWRKFSIWFLIIAILWVGVSTLYLTNSLPILEKLTTTTPLTLLLLYGMFYCSQQSTKHNDESRRSLRLALQIKSLNPYINPLEKEERSEVISQLVDRFFIGAENLETKEKDSNSMSLLISELSKIVQQAKIK